MDRYQPNSDLLSTVQQLLSRHDGEKLPKYKTRGKDVRSGTVAGSSEAAVVADSFLDSMIPGKRYWFVSRLEKVAHHFWVEYYIEKPLALSRSAGEGAASVWETKQLLVSEHYYCSHGLESPVKMGPHVFKSPWRATGLDVFSPPLSVQKPVSSSSTALGTKIAEISADVLRRRPDAKEIACTYQGCYGRCNISSFIILANHSQQLIAQMHDELKQRVAGSMRSESQPAAPGKSPAIPAGIESSPRFPLLPPYAHPAAGAAAEHGPGSVPPPLLGTLPRPAPSGFSSEQLEAQTMCGILSSALKCMPSAASMEKYADASQQAVQVDTVRAAFFPATSADSTPELREMQAPKLPTNAHVLVPGATVGTRTVSSSGTDQLSPTAATVLEFLNLAQGSVFHESSVAEADKCAAMRLAVGVVQQKLSPT